MLHGARGPAQGRSYVHGHDTRLFDLAADPGEWKDLAAQRHDASCAPLILERFDPDAIAADGARERRAGAT